MPEPNSTGAPWSNTLLTHVVDCRELFRGKSRQASLDGNPTYTRIFLVRVNTVKPNLHQVAAAPGIAWREVYPDDANAFLVESNVSQDGDSAFHYKVTFQYRYLDESEKIPWRRPAVFSFSGSLASAPCFWHYPNEGDNNTKQVIVNTAKDPLSGLDRDEGEFNVTISYNQKPPFYYDKAQLYVGAINSDVWSGGQPKTWKCQSITANRKTETIPGNDPNSQAPVKVIYYETSITCAYRSTGWDLQTWNVGFNEIKSGKRSKILAGGDPVSEPAALNANGTQKTPGQPPDLLTFRIYRTLPFVGTFYQIPTDVLAGWPYTEPQIPPT
jgi:hypothetical protein